MLAYAHGVQAEQQLATLDSLWMHWAWDPTLLLVLISAICYGVGSRLLRRRSLKWQVALSGWRLSSFWIAIFCLVLSLASPLDYLADHAFSFHMIQHTLIILVAMPLLMLGNPLLAVLYGLPRLIRRSWLPPLARWKPLRRLWQLLFMILPSLVLFELVQIGWHLPFFYRAALDNEAIHYLQHFCFLLGAFFFWLNLIQPYPLKKRLHPLLACLTLFVAAIINSMVSAMIAFAEKPLYGYQGLLEHVWGISVLEEQRLGAALMWTMGSMLYLVAILLLFLPYAYKAYREDLLEADLQQKLTQKLTQKLPLKLMPKTAP